MRLLIAFALAIVGVVGPGHSADRTRWEFEAEAFGTTRLQALESAIAKLETQADQQEAADRAWDTMLERRIDCRSAPGGYSCSVRAVSELTMRVDRGKLVDPYRHPWQVVLVTRGGGELLCGAVRIRLHWLLTAAHCVSSDQPPAAARVLPVSTYAKKIRFAVASEYPSHPARKAETDEGNYPGLLIEVAEIVIHPDYDASTHRNDIALLKLSGIKGADRQLLDVFPTQFLEEGVPLKVSGYGRLSSNARLSRSGRPCCTSARGEHCISIAEGAGSRRPVEDAGPCVAA